MINTVEEAIGQLKHVQLDSQFSPDDIVHMILGGGPSQSLFNIETGAHQRAVDFLCQESGLIKEDDQGRPYFTKANGHTNEFPGILAKAGIHFDTTRIITNHGNEGTLADLANAAMERYAPDSEEPSWSLMLFSVYPGVIKEWKNELGELHSVERILPLALKRAYGDGASFGTNILEGLSFAVSHFCLAQDVEPAQLQGVWKDSFDYIAGAMELMERNLHEDGSIDRCWFRKKSFPRGKNEWSEKMKDVFLRRFNPPKAIVYPTGHCLDAISPLAIFLSEQRQWIYNACYLTAQTIQNHWIPLASEIAPLTHAVHALKLLGE